MCKLSFTVGSWLKFARPPCLQSGTGACGIQAFADCGHQGCQGAGGSIVKEVRMARTKAATSRWDVVDNLGSDKRIAAYLEAALEDGDPQVVTAAIGDIARARGMMQLARETGLTREGLYKAFGPNGNPSFATVMKVARALGVKLTAQSA